MVTVQQPAQATWALAPRLVVEIYSNSFPLAQSASILRDISGDQEIEIGNSFTWRYEQS